MNENNEQTKDVVAVNSTDLLSVDSSKAVALKTIRYHRSKIHEGNEMMCNLFDEGWTSINGTSLKDEWFSITLYHQSERIPLG